MPPPPRNSAGPSSAVRISAHQEVFLQTMKTASSYSRHLTPMTSIVRTIMLMCNEQYTTKDILACGLFVHCGWPSNFSSSSFRNALLSDTLQFLWIKETFTLIGKLTSDFHGSWLLRKEACKPNISFILNGFSVGSFLHRKA